MSVLYDLYETPDMITGHDKKNVRQKKSPSKEPRWKNCPR